MPGLWFRHDLTARAQAVESVLETLDSDETLISSSTGSDSESEKSTTPLVSGVVQIARSPKHSAPASSMTPEDRERSAGLSAMLDELLAMSSAAAVRQAAHSGDTSNRRPLSWPRCPSSWKISLKLRVRDRSERPPLGEAVPSQVSTNLTRHISISILVASHFEQSTTLLPQPIKSIAYLK